MRRAAGLLLLLLAAACGDRGGEPPCLARVPDAPTQVFDEMPEPPVDGVAERIVTLAPGLTELVAHLDGVERLVGVTPWCNHPAGVKDIAKVSVLPLDFEGIVALRPTLVIADRTLHTSGLEQLRRRFPKSLLELETSRSLADLRGSMVALAHRLGRGGQAKSWLARYDAEVDSWRAPARKRPLRVLVVSEWDPLNVIGPFGLMHDMLRLAGCVNVACDTNMPSGAFSPELVLERRPDVILHRTGPPPERLRGRWRGVPALEQGRLANCEADDLARGGPRVLDALARLRKVLHGEAPMHTLAGGS